MKKITENLLEIETIKNYLEKVKQNQSPITILGLSDVSKACIVAETEKTENRSILLITYNELQAQNLYQHLKNISDNVTYIPKKDIITYEYDAQSMDILYSRIEGLIKLLNDDTKITVISAETAMQRVLSKKTMQNNILKIMVANEYNIGELKEKLVELGYERYDIVEGKGTFSVRGDILDVAVSDKKGIRVEFFGDEVDQIRYFDISSQRGIENVNQIKIYPLSEEIDVKPKGSIFEYLTKNSIIVFDEISKIKLRTENILKDNKLLIKDLIEKKKNVPYILENMYDMDYINSIAEKHQTIKLESNDLMKNAENAITLKYEEVRKIDDNFFDITKEAKEKKTHKPRTRHSKEFREAEKVSFSDLKVRRLCSS